jgi:hypothetical protein
MPPNVRENSAKFKKTKFLKGLLILEHRKVRIQIGHYSKQDDHKQRFQNLQITITWAVTSDIESEKDIRKDNEKQFHLL